MRAIIKKEITLSEDHKTIVSMLEDTMLDRMIIGLWSHYYPQCHILINDIDVSHSFDVWKTANLEVGQTVVVEVVPKWRLE